MRPKQFVMVMIIILGAFSLIMVAIGGAYIYFPSALGIVPKKNAKDTTKALLLEKVKRDTVPIVPSVLITESRLKEFEKNIIVGATLSSDKDSLFKYANHLQDSISKIYSNQKIYKDSSEYFKKNIADIKKFNNKLLDSILQLSSSTKKAKDKADFVEKRMKELEDFYSKKQDSLDKKNFEDYAKMYNNSNPVDVAKILERIDERDASRILKLMSVKKAGKVLESMKPEQAAAILLLGANSQ